MRRTSKYRRFIVDRKIVEALLAGNGVNFISRTLRVGKKRIKKIRLLATEAGYLDGTVPIPVYPAVLFPGEKDGREEKSSFSDAQLMEHRDFIQDRITAGWHAVSVFEELPIKVARSSFYRFLKRHGLYRKNQQPRRVIPEICHHPGSALLVDWGKVGSYLDPQTGKSRTVWAFVGILGYSRYRMVRLVVSQDTSTTMQMLESMFQELGGVPAKITSDNAKCFAIQASRYEPLLNPVYERFAAYYGTQVECLPPSSPEKKGKVERPIPHIRRLFESYDGPWQDICRAQEFIDRKLNMVNEVRHGTTGERPIERLLEVEASALKPLPKLFWLKEECHEGIVRKDGHVRFRGKYYSLPEHYIGQKVQVIGNPETVWIYSGGQLLETHKRLTDDLRSKSTKPDHLKPWEKAMSDTSAYRDRALSMGPYVDEFIVRIIGTGLEMVDLRKVWGLLNLDKTYSSHAINEACRKALAMGSIRLRLVQEILAASLVKKEDIKKSEIEHFEQCSPPHAHVYRFIRPITEYEAMVASGIRS